MPDSVPAVIVSQAKPTEIDGHYVDDLCAVFNQLMILRHKEPSGKGNVQELQTMLRSVRTYSDYWSMQQPDTPIDGSIMYRVKLLDIYAQMLQNKGRLDCAQLSSTAVQRGIEDTILSMKKVMYGPDAA